LVILPVFGPCMPHQPAAPLGGTRRASSSRAPLQEDSSCCLFSC
jgi:hypothetical protein